MKKIIPIVLTIMLLSVFLVGCGDKAKDNREAVATSFCNAFYDVEDNTQTERIVEADSFEKETLIINLYEPLKEFLTENAFNKLAMNSFLYTYRKNCADESVLPVVDKDSISFETKNEDTFIMSFSLVSKETGEIINEQTIEMSFDDNDKIDSLFFYDTSFSLE